MTLWRQYGVAFRLALMYHYLAAYPSTNEAAHALGMDKSDFRRTWRRLRVQAGTVIPVDGIRSPR
ncbi:MAG: hypothetical protein HW395_45 [candidate division NC10 bacterium]|nr:hypothetical protein [candidate division NC10 bacterium]